MEDIFEDDGSLACLHIPADKANKRFICKEERQENLIGKTFWLQGFFPDVQTRFDLRHLYKASYEREAPDSESFKVFTGAADPSGGRLVPRLAEVHRLPQPRIYIKPI